MSKKDKCSESQKNRLVIHLGNEEKRIFRDELDYFKDLGWVEGISDSHRNKLSKSSIGKNLGNTNGFTKNSIPPWNKGKQGLQVAWNKGLTKDTDERVAKYSKTLTGTVGHRKGQKNTPEQNKKIGASLKGRKYGKLPEDRLKIFLSKSYATKKLNNSFNTSKPEEALYESLLNDYLLKNKTVLRRYKDEERYPYYCDFYIPEEDLFIELNAHWTHGGRPFDPNDVSCITQLEEWREKAKTSRFYENAINTWTVRDVEKQACAKKHNLNYKAIY